MFSSRLQWDFRENRLTKLALGKRSEGAEILDLTVSNPTQAGFDFPRGEILDAFGSDPYLVYEPLPSGLVSARKAVALYYSSREERISHEDVFLTASTSEAYAYLFKLLCDPGDDVLVPAPSYPLFEFLAGLESVVARHYPVRYDGRRWVADLDGLQDALSARTRAVVVVNPNNPTGSFLHRDETERLVELCRQRRLSIVSDEVFSDYLLTPDSSCLGRLANVDKPLVFRMSGLSKICGLPQMKLAWIVASGSWEPMRKARKRLELIADTYLSVGSPVQHAAPSLLKLRFGIQAQILARLRENVRLLKTMVSESSPCRALAVQGGWYGILELPRTRSEEEWCLELLDKDGVLAQPGYFYDFESEAFLVLSLLTPSARFQEGVRRLLARVESL